MTLSVDRDRFVDLAGGDRPAVVYAAADLDVDAAPLSAYAALSGRTTEFDGGAHTYLLESAEKVASSDPDGAFAPETDDRHARFSFVGWDPAAVVTVAGDGSTTVEADDRVADLVVPDGDGSTTAGSGDGDDPDPSRSGDDVLDTLRAALPGARLAGFPEGDRQRLDGGLVGFLGYDAVYDLWLDDVDLDRPDSRFPDARFALSTRTLRYDHAEGDVELVFTPVVREDEDAGRRYDELVETAERIESLLAGADAPAPGGFERVAAVAGSRETYEAAVERAKESVLSGDIYQGVISRTRELYGEMDALGLYDALRAINPSPYMYLLDDGETSVVGASPETLVSVAGERVVSNPIAGTCPRGSSPVEDRRLAGEMLADGKERAEHTMLVDLARNDVRRVARAGSVRVEEFMNVLKYSHVQHIESTVTGRLAEAADAFDAVRATFPAGTLAGAPKIRAMEIIDDLEESPRGPYGGGVGYVSWTGDTDFAIVIRSATVERDAAVPASVDAGVDRTDRTTVRAGAGIVADSVPESEYEETEKKMGGVIDAVERIERPAGPGEETTTGDATGDDDPDPAPAEPEGVGR